MLRIPFPIISSVPFASVVSQFVVSLGLAHIPTSSSLMKRGLLGVANYIYHEGRVEVGCELLDELHYLGCW